jgi:hypothetical protein
MDFVRLDNIIIVFSPPIEELHPTIKKDRSSLVKNGADSFFLLACGRPVFHVGIKPVSK